MGDGGVGVRLWGLGPRELGCPTSLFLSFFLDERCTCLQLATRGSISVDFSPFAARHHPTLLCAAPSCYGPTHLC